MTSHDHIRIEGCYRCVWPDDDRQRVTPSPLSDLAEKLERVAELLARSRNPFERAYGKHFESDAKAARLMAMTIREPAEVVGT